VVTVVIGKMFGGALKGVIPLGMCLSSGVWLWMKEVIRSGREVEWDSEKTRGQMVRLLQTCLRIGSNATRLLQISFQNRLSG
jgi:hypothetical protein